MYGQYRGRGVNSVSIVGRLSTLRSVLIGGSTVVVFRISAIIYTCAHNHSLSPHSLRQVIIHTRLHFPILQAAAFSSDKPHLPTYSSNRYIHTHYVGDLFVYTVPP